MLLLGVHFVKPHKILHKFMSIGRLSHDKEKEAPKYC